MRKDLHVTASLHGRFRDVMRDSRGQVIFDSGWTANTIVNDCRRLLAGFMRGTPTLTLGIQGLQVGMGNPDWDRIGTPSASPTQTSLFDSNPWTVNRADLQLEYLDPSTGNVSANPTSRIQIVAQLGNNVPPWPDINHTSSTLREFGLEAELDGSKILINCVHHPAIVKDRTSTLERTIWLVF